MAQLGTTTTRGNSSSYTQEASTTQQNRAVAYTNCLRSHGVPGFPDPTGGGEIPNIPLQQLGVSNSQLQAAQQACQSLSPKQVSALSRAAQRRSRAFAATPLTDLGARTYERQTGGLYPGGHNTVPAAHAAAGLARAHRIQPLNRAGHPDPHGKIVLLSISMSNGSAEWCGTTTCASTSPSGRSFMAQAAASPAVNHQTLVIVNGAKGGQVASRWTSPRSPDYDLVRDQQLAPMGVTEQQVQVVWLKEADAFPHQSLPSRSADAYTLERLLGDITRALKARYSHLQQVFLTSRTYGGYATTTLNPEPYAYESGFSAKWLIQAQIQQIQQHGTITDPRAGNLDDNTAAPWIAWGPYLWADGTRPRSDGLRWRRSDLGPDGTHLSPAGITKVGHALLTFFLNSPYTHCWFRTPSKNNNCGG